MPSTMTHTYLGIDVINNLPIEYQKKLNNNFKLFCQGPDPYMFYHFFIGNKGKNIQSKMHTQKTKDFFINTIKYIYDNDYVNNQEIMSYLYGYICHYYLDLQTHPLINYQSGIFKNNDKETHNYNGLHQKIEYQIDLYMIEQREKIKPSKFKIHKNIFQIKKFSKELINLINTTLKQTYNYHNAAKLYYSSAHYMKQFFKIFNYDPYGIKHNIYKILDKITPNSIINTEELSFHQKYNKKHLNLNHEKWYYTWDNTKYQTESFNDLYQIALNNATNTIIKITNMLKENTWNEKLLNELFQDLSYITGLPCNTKIKMKYFKN